MTPRVSDLGVIHPTSAKRGNQSITTFLGKLMSTRFDQQTEDAIIISDLHLAAMSGSGLFRADAELAAFLDWVRRETKQSTLILNGDTLDLLAPETDSPAIKPFDLIDAPRCARAITEHHPEVFDRLAALAQSPAHELVMLGGNHDPEVAFPAVKRVIEERLGANTANTPIRWLAHGEAAALSIGETIVLIEHGDVLDDWNRIDHQSLLVAVKLATRGLIDHLDYNPPPGSYLVVNHLNTILNQYPWVDRLKPEWEAVIPVLYELLPFEQKARLLDDVGPWLSLVGRAAGSYFRRTKDRADLFRTGEEAITSRNERRRQFIEWFNETKEPSRRGKSVGESEEKIIKRLRKAAAEDSFFKIDSFDSSSEDVRFLIEQGADVVVHGHTHAAKAYQLGRGLYFNSGTWGELMQLPSSDAGDVEWQRFFDDLRLGREAGFLRPTFIRIGREAGTTQTTAALMEWQSPCPAIHASFRFDPNHCAWEQEG